MGLSKWFLREVRSTGLPGIPLDGGRLGLDSFSCTWSHEQSEKFTTPMCDGRHSYPHIDVDAVTAVS